MDEHKYIIECNKLAIGYHHKRVSANISFTAKKGELVALIGSNGIGKSTLMRTILGLQPLLSGECFVTGKPVHTILKKEGALLASFVSTEPLRVDNLTVYELLMLGRIPYANWFGNLNDRDHEIIKQCISQTHIEHLAGKQMNELSDGERQRALIARALTQDTPILFLDEPTAFLDISTKHDIIHLLQMLAHNQNKTIVFSTHDLSTAISHADCIWLMNEKQHMQGAPEDLVLSGILNNMFSHLSFDINTATYKVMRDTGKTIALECSDAITYQWCRMALERIGFAIDNEGSCLTTIHVDIDSKNYIYQLSHNNENYSYVTLYELIDRLKHKCFMRANGCRHDQFWI